MNNNEKGFALVLSLVLMLVMSLMGGALIVISAGDHQGNNKNENYQQTFYVAETALLEGEKYILNQALGPWNVKSHTRDMKKRNLPKFVKSRVKNISALKEGGTPDSAWGGSSGKIYNFKEPEKQPKESEGLLSPRQMATY